MVSKRDYAGYWDKKLEYFRKTEDLENPRADVPKGDIIEQFINLLDIESGDILLDVGCGYGRLFPFFLQKGAVVYGVDVSPRMIEEAQKKYYDNTKVRFFLMNAEQLDFEDKTFDKIFCYGVFDALECHYEALSEIARVIKSGGKMMISGKHKPYHEDDEEAKIAEEKAAEVNHPNFFIHWKDLENEISINKLKIKHSFFYERRGDSTKDIYLAKAPKIFYEFNLILEKID